MSAFSHPPASALQAQALEALRGLSDPLTGKDWVASRCVDELSVQGSHATVHMALDHAASSCWPQWGAEIETALTAVAGISSAQVSWRTRIHAHQAVRGQALLPHVKNIIAVASGKGGVGKSTTAINLAFALQAEGAQVGLLDADIYGPSQPTMLGVEGRPQSPDGKSIDPPRPHGLPMMSIGLLIEGQAPAIWRGPMATQAFDQMLRLSNWASAEAPLDYLIVDMPPGTGDVHLSISQRCPLTAAVIVTTPQDIALLDARKGLEMFNKVGVPVLGVVENMAVYHCPNCGHEAHIFGHEGGQRLAQDSGVALLGAMPLDLNLRRDSDQGVPTVLSDPQGPLAARYREMAKRLSAALAGLPKDHNSRLPGVRVEPAPAGSNQT